MAGNGLAVKILADEWKIKVVFGIMYALRKDEI